MKVPLVLAISVWALLALACRSLELDIKDGSAANYAEFLRDLRNAAKDTRLAYHGIPMMPKALAVKSYHVVELKFTEGRAISMKLALDKDNLYVVAYCDKDAAGKARAHFFPDAPANAKTVLFPEAIGTNNRVDIKYESRYDTKKGLENKAGTRKDVGLGFGRLREYMLQLDGKNNGPEKSQARFLLMSIQMVAEAARFMYIQKQVVENFDSYFFTPNSKVISYENNWGKTSAAIRRAPSSGPNSGAISPSIQLEDEDGDKWTVNKVSQIKTDMGLLLYVA